MNTAKRVSDRPLLSLPPSSETAREQRALDIAGRTLVSMTPGWTRAEALSAFEDLRVAAAPVVDGHGVVLGVASWRDALPGGDGPLVFSSPAVVLPPDATVAQAAEALAHCGFHHLVIVDAVRRPLGVISAVDVVRAVVGDAPTHPPPSTFFDPTSWTQAAPVSEETAAALPPYPGILALVRRDGLDASDVLWAEATSDLATRALDLACAPQLGSSVAQVLRQPGIRIRVRTLSDGVARERELARLVGECPRCDSPAG